MPATASEAHISGLPPLLTTADVLAVLGVSRPTLWRLEKKGAFPKAIAIGRMKRWQRDDISAFINAHKAAA